MAALLASCADGRRYNQAICALIDVSGTYADEKAEVASILKRDVLPSMLPGDTLLVIRIDSGSYEKDNIEALVTLDPRPSRANAQKLALARRLDAFAARGGRVRLHGHPRRHAARLRIPGRDRGREPRDARVQRPRAGPARRREASDRGGRVRRHPGRGHEREAPAQRQRRPRGLPGPARELGGADARRRRRRAGARSWTRRSCPMHLAQLR